MEIVELSRQLHLVRPTFGQVYLWQEGTQLTMIDTGIPGSEVDLAAAFAELGFRRRDLRRVVLTHAHEDHAGAAGVVRSWGDVEVLAHRDEAEVVRGERPNPAPDLTAAEQALLAQVSAGLPALPPCPVDTELEAGDIIAFADGAHVISTPGHTDGSIAVWLPRHRVLFTGDIVANTPQGVCLGPFNTDRVGARGSVVRLSQRPAETVCFGHGDPLNGPAGTAIWRAFGVRCAAGADAVPDPLG